MTATLQIRKKAEANNPRLEFERVMGLELTTLPGTARHIVPGTCTVRQCVVLFGKQAFYFSTPACMNAKPLDSRLIRGVTPLYLYRFQRIPPGLFRVGGVHFLRRLMLEL